MSKIFNLLTAVRLEVESSFSKEEIQTYSNFEDFWNSVDVQNAYEEEWQAHLNAGIKAVYKAVFEELRK